MKRANKKMSPAKRKFLRELCKLDTAARSFIAATEGIKIAPAAKAVRDIVRGARRIVAIADELRSKGSNKS